MGTTGDAVRTQASLTLGYVLVIEGYPYLLSDHVAPTAAGIGWGATDWTDALSGLEVVGSMSQRLEPWSNELEIPTLTFRVLPDSTDRFARDMFKDRPSIRTELTTAFDSSDHTAGFPMIVKNAAQFPPASTVYVGNEAFNVTGTPAGSTIPIPAAGSGYLAPFCGDVGGANRFPGPHYIISGDRVGDAFGASDPVYVSDSPASWHGKKVGLWAHRIVAGVWDTKAEAELLFAGTISTIGEINLSTVVACEGIQKSLLDTTLLTDQWSGRIKSGFELLPGDWIQVAYNGYDLSSHNYSVRYVVDDIAGFVSGLYTAEELGSLFADLFDSDFNVGAAGISRQLRWSAGVSTTAVSRRWFLSATNGSTVTAGVGLHSNSEALLNFLGFTNIKKSSAGTTKANATPYSWSGSVTKAADDPIVLTADRAPLIVAQPRDGNNIEFRILDAAGTFIEHSSSLPPSAQEEVAVGIAGYSYFIVDDKTLVFGNYNPDTALISGVTVDHPISRTADLQSALLQSTNNDNGIIKQVYFSSDTFCNTVARLFASTDGNGQNHATHDVLPWGAGIPWEILGTAFTDSLSSIEQSGSEDSISLLIEKPIRLWDAIKSDFALRMAHPIWKDGGIVIAQFTTPNASDSDHTLNESNKSDEKRSKTAYNSSLMAHTLKIEHSRSPLTDTYLGTYIARNEVGYQNSGQGGVTKTIKARNSYAELFTAGASVEALADILASRFLPLLSKPSKVFTRSIAHTLFHMAPGDTCTFSDDFIRDPTTGERGVANRAGVITGVRWSYGISSGGQGYFGECDILYTEEDRLFPLTPSMEHRNTYTAGAYTNGWDSTAKKILVGQSNFTSTGNDSDGFVAGDEIRLTEIDPADPLTADSYLDTIVSIATDSPAAGYDAIELTSGFGVSGRPAFDGTKTYLINFAEFDVVDDSQKLYAYQADDTDGLILDVAEPNILGDFVKHGAAAADITELPSRHSSRQYGDGAPLSASFLRDQARMANNLTNYKTAPAGPFLTNVADIVSTASETTYHLLRVFPFLIGSDSWSGGRKRQLQVAPKYHTGSGSGGTAYVRVTSSANPPRGDSYSLVEFEGPKQQVVFTTTSTTDIIDVVQQLNVVRSSWLTSMTWITIEGGDLVSFDGLGELWLGPIL